MKRSNLRVLVGPEDTGIGITAIHVSLMILGKTPIGTLTGIPLIRDLKMWTVADDGLSPLQPPLKMNHSLKGQPPLLIW